MISFIVPLFLYGVLLWFLIFRGDLPFFHLVPLYIYCELRYFHVYKFSLIHENGQFRVD